VQLQYIVTKAAGVINIIDGIPVFPKALESIVIIDGWQYASQENQLALRIAIGTADSTWTSDGQLISGSGDGQVFFRMATNVQADGKMSPVQISGKTSVAVDGAFKNPLVEAQLKSRYQGSASCQIVDILFPPGASYIVYDPTMGSGQSPFSPTETNNNVLVISVAVSGSIAIVLAIGAFIIYKRNKKSAYTTIE